MAIWIRTPNPPKGGGAQGRQSGKGSEGRGSGSGGKAGGRGVRPDAGIMSDGILFISEHSIFQNKGETILQENLTYEPEALEKATDSFYCLFNHSIKETAEIFAEDAFTPSQWEEYQKMYGIELDVNKIKEKIELARLTTAPEIDRSWRPSFVGQANVPKTLIGIPKNMTREKNVEAMKPQMTVYLDMSYNCGYDAQKIVTTLMCIINILQNSFEDYPGFTIKALLGTKLGLSEKSKEATGQDELVIWSTQTVSANQTLYSWIHYFMPMAHRGIEFIWHANIHKVYDLSVNISEDFKSRGMGMPFPQGEEDEYGMYTLGELYEKQPNLQAFDDEIRKEGINTEVLFIKVSSVSTKFNAFDRKQDIIEFAKVMKEKVNNLEEQIQ